MANVKISALTSGSIPTGLDIIPIVDYETLSTTGVRAGYLAAYVTASIQQLNLNSLTASNISTTTLSTTGVSTLGGNSRVTGSIGISDNLVVGNSITASIGARVIGKIAIGESIITASGHIEVAADTLPGVNRGIHNTQYGSHVGSALFAARKARGGILSATTVADADYVGGFIFQPFLATGGFTETAGIVARISGTVTSTTAPTQIVFYASNTAVVDPMIDKRLVVEPTGVRVPGKLAIGSSLLTASAELEVCSDAATGVNRGIQITEYGGDIGAALQNFRKARGTIASPTTVNNGDYVSAIIFRPFLANGGFTETAGILARISGTVASTSAPTQISFYTSDQVVSDPSSPDIRRLILEPNGNIVFNEGGQICSVRMESSRNTSSFFLSGSSGYLGLNTSNPRQQLDVNGNGYFNNTLTASQVSIESPNPATKQMQILLTGSAAGSVRHSYYQESLITTDDTPIMIQQINTVGGTIYMVEARVMAVDQGYLELGAAIIRARYTHSSGSLLLRNQENAYSAFSTGSWGANFISSGSNITLMVTGAAGKNVNWTTTTVVDEIRRVPNF